MIPTYKFPFKSTNFRKIINHYINLRKNKKAILSLGREIGEIIEPILDHLGLFELIKEGTINLTIRPDSKVVKIPWELAVLKDDLETLLCERVNFSRTMQVEYNQGYGVLTNKTVNKNYPALIVGLDYEHRKLGALSHSREDAKNVFSIIKTFGKSKGVQMLPIVLEKHASSEIIIDHLLKGITLFHFSGHGKINKRTGEISGFKSTLSTRQLDKQFCKSNARAPTFSFINACKTCVQSTKGGEVFDWAKLMASNGGRALTGTLWSVIDDDATEFSLKFYLSFFSEGRTLGESVRLSRRYLKDSSEHSMETWAAFVCYGPSTLRANDLLV